MIELESLIIRKIFLRDKLLIILKFNKWEKNLTLTLSFGYNLEIGLLIINNGFSVNGKL